MTTWTYQDYLDEKCEAGDVGEERPPPEIDEVIPIEQSLTDMLSIHSRQAYVELGGKDYLKRNPALLNKVILRQVEGPVRRVVTYENHAQTLEQVRPSSHGCRRDGPATK
ncbi:hypothetical protein QTI24_13150 [Variovorax sp. J22P240]|uniref:hypothetical protein n=1 Tax=Variovorax sp. J22P240 TaxID=3053514 RepID=UPI0025774B4C|nr:hypothetical protein [Variovorax sp. J22P240]MDL9999559.1 hypothetical protein [Variovorax sp. J22P240]